MKNKKVFLSLLIGLFCLFTSCQNFANGSLFKTELDDSIFYAQAKAYKLIVEAEEGTGTVSSGSGDNELKVTDKLTLRFAKAKGYKFIEWRAVQKDDKSVSMDEYVEFKNKKSTETTVKLIKAPENEILILPYCEETLYITENTVPKLKEEGVPRDSSIKLVFSAALTEDNDLTKIDISIEGSDVDGNKYFNDPKYVDGQIIITANLDNRISVIGDETKIINIRIPSDFTYVGKNGESVAIDEDLTYSYKINSSTSDKTYITFGTEDENAGIFKVNGIASTSVGQNYNIGESITVTFKVNEGYVFDGWECSDEGSLYVTLPDPVENPEYDEKGFDKETSTAMATITVINESTNVTFRAIFHKLGTAAITGISEYGRYSYDINGTYIEGKGGTLGFTPEPDYQFICWQVWDTTSDKNVTDSGYITFADAEKSNTNFTLKLPPTEDIVLNIQPLCAIRPKIISATPYYEASGVYRDRTIVILFDNIMEEKSIYYSEKEQTELTNSGYKLLKAGGKCYGYWDGKTDSSIKFKNITITEVENPDVNLLKYYGKPVFDSNNKRFLRIPVVSNNPPPVSLDIMVSIFKNMSAKIETDGITSSVYLKEKYTFSYRTNGSVDSNEPKFVAMKIKNGDNTVLLDDFYLGRSKKDAEDNYEIEDYKSILAKENYLHPDKNNEASDDYVGNRTVNDLIISSNIPTHNLSQVNSDGSLVTNKDLHVYGQIQDEESGPASLQWKITKIDSKYYPLGKECEKRGQIANFKVSGYTAEINERIKLKELELPEGAYQITLYAYDVNENISERTYYFIWDNVGPTVPNEISESRTDVKYTQITCKTPSDVDLDCSKAKVKTKDVTNKTVLNGASKTTISDVEFGEYTKNSNTTYNIGSDTEGNLEDQHKYKYTICFYDYAGNCSFVSTQDETVPAKVPDNGVTNTRESVDEETITLNWEKAPSDVSRVIMERWDLSGKNKLSGPYTIVRGTDTKHAFDGLVDQTKYKYKLFSVDYSGNISNPLEWQDDVGPTTLVSLDSISNTRTKASEETIKWTPPSDNDIHHFEIDRYLGDSKKATFKLSKTDKTQLVTGLVNQSKYTYRFYSVDYSGNRSAQYTAYTDNKGATSGKTDTIYGGGRDKKLRIYYNDPTGDDEIARIRLYVDNSLKEEYDYDGKGTHRVFDYTFTNGTSHTVVVKTLDYAGNFYNASSTITEKAGVAVGDICYENYSRNEIFCSANYHGGKDNNKVTVKGIICNTSDLTKVRVWDIKEESGANYNWGKNTGDIKYDKGRACDGLAEYNYFYDNLLRNTMTFGYHHEGRGAVSDSDSYTYWYHIWKDSRSGTRLKWYIPGMWEINNVFCGSSNSSVVSKMNTAVSTLSKNGVSATIRERGTLLITSTPSSDSAYYHLIKDNSILDNRSEISYEQTNKDYCYRDCRGDKISRLHLMAQINMN